MFARATLILRLTTIVGLLGVSFLFLSASLIAQERATSNRDVKADAELKLLSDKVKALDESTLRQKLTAFRLSHYGTKAAVKAAEMFSALSCPLDRLESNTIAELEKFDWQPKELVGILGEHRGRHGNPVTSVAFNHEGTQLVSGGGSYVRLWDTEKMRLVGLGGHYTVLCVAFSKDGKFAVSGSSNGTVIVWNVSDKGLHLRHSITAATSPVYSVSVHPDNKLIACGCFDNVVRLYDVSGTKAEEAGMVSGHTKAVRAVAYSPDGKLMATGSEDSTARIFDTADPKNYKEKSRLEGTTASVLSVAWSRGGKTVATGDSIGMVQLWGVPAVAKPKAPNVQFQGPKASVTSLSFDEKSATLASAFSDNSVRLWSVMGKAVKEKLKLEGHKDKVNAVAYSQSGKLLATGADDWTCRTWDMTKTKNHERFVPWSHLSHIYSVAFSTDATTVATGSYDRNVRLWDLDKAELKTKRYLPFEAQVYAVAYSPDGKYVAAGGASTTVKQWDPTKLGTKMPCKSNPTHVYHLSYSPDSKSLLAGSGKEVVMFESARGSEIKRFTHETHITSAGFSPDGTRLVATSGNYLYQDGKIVTRNGKYVYTDCVMRVYDIDKSEEATVIKDEPTPFYASCWSVDGTTMYGGNYEAKLRRWGFKSDKLTEQEGWKGTSGYVHGIWPTPDGKHLITRGMDSSLILWEAATGKRLKSWSFQEQVGGVAISGDSRHVGVGLGTGVVYVLRIASSSVNSKD